MASPPSPPRDYLVDVIKFSILEDNGGPSEENVQALRKQQQVMEKKFAAVSDGDTNALRAVLREYSEAVDETEAQFPMTSLEPLMRVARKAVDNVDLPLFTHLIEAFHATAAYYCGILRMCETPGVLDLLLQLCRLGTEKHREMLLNMCECIVDLVEDYPAVAAYFRPLYQAVNFDRALQTPDASSLGSLQVQLRNIRREFDFSDAAAVAEAFAKTSHTN